MGGLNTGPGGGATVHYTTTDPVTGKTTTQTTNTNQLLAPAGLNGNKADAGSMQIVPPAPPPPPPPPVVAPPPPPPPPPPAPTGELMKPSYSENFFNEVKDDYLKDSARETVNKEHGAELFDTLSNSEQLYNQGIGALNPFYDYAEERAQKAARAGAAARGDFNTSYAQRQEGDISANLRGQQAKDMAGLAGQADNAKLGRYGLGQGFAAGADAGFLNRTGQGQSAAGQVDSRKFENLNSYFTNALGLGNAESGATNPFAGELDDLGYDKEALQAELEKLGMDAKTAQTWMDTLGSLGGLGAILKPGGKTP